MGPSHPAGRGKGGRTPGLSSAEASFTFGPDRPGIEAAGVLGYDPGLPSGGSREDPTEMGLIVLFSHRLDERGVVDLWWHRHAAAREAELRDAE